MNSVKTDSSSHKCYYIIYDLCVILGTRRYMLKHTKQFEHTHTNIQMSKNICDILLYLLYDLVSFACRVFHILQCMLRLSAGGKLGHQAFL